MRMRPAVSSVAALVSLALCVPANRAGAATAGPTSTAGREAGLTLTTKTPTGQRGHWFVGFEEEIGQAAGSSQDEGRSLRGAAEVDCGASQFQVAKLEVFEGPNFTGALLLDVGKRVEWRTPEPGTTLDRVLAVACGKTRLQAKVQARARAAGAGPPALDPPAPPSAASEPPARAEAAATVAPTTALPTAASIAPSSGGGGAFYAQLASLPSADAARQAWNSLKGAAPGILDDRLRRVTTAIVHGRTVYRVSAGGFGTKAQAEMVCKALAHLSAGCFVRPADAA